MKQHPIQVNFNTHAKLKTVANAQNISIGTLLERFADTLEAPTPFPAIPDGTPITKKVVQRPEGDFEEQWFTKNGVRVK